MTKYQSKPDGTAYCPCCAKFKLFEEFNRNSSRPDGRSAYCSLCARVKANQANAAKKAVRGLSELTRIRHAIAALQMKEATLIEEIARGRLRSIRSPKGYARALVAKQVAASIPRELVIKKCAQLELSRMSRSMQSAAVAAKGEHDETI